MGFGFYGRSFQLSDPSCSTPGCAFSGGGDAGPCSATSGILMYYEIQAILNQVDGLEPVYDEDAAVKYLVFDDDQWVSYDDADTFGDKLAWANAIGIGGSLIWAADTDDDQFTAMSGLLGEEVSHVDTTTSLSVKTLAVTESSVVSTLIGQNGQDCSLMKSYSCTHKDNLRCESGYTLVGWDRDGCSVSRGTYALVFRTAEVLMRNLLDLGRQLRQANLLPRSNSAFKLPMFVLFKPLCWQTEANSNQGAEVVATATANAILENPLS